jgi:hypothetical protein
MDNYIKQVLLEENTIILPKLGALTVTSIKTGEMMFLSYLNYDDGKLAKFVAEKENITEDEARAKVKTFVEEIKEKIDNGLVFNLGKLGHFFKKNEEVFFEDYAVYEDQEEETEDQIKIIEIEVPDKVETTENKAIEEIKEEIVDEPAEIIETKSEEPAAKSLDDILNSPVQEIVEEVQEIETPIEDEPIVPETIISESTVPETFVPEGIVSESTIEEEVKTNSEEPKIEFLDVPATASPDPIASRSQQEEKVQVENTYVPKRSSLVSKEIKAGISQNKAPKEQVKSEPKEQIKTETKAQEKITEIKPKKEKGAKEKKKKGAFFWILMVLLGLGFTGGILTFMFYDQVKKYIPFIESSENKEQKQIDTVSIENLNNSAEELEAAEDERINAESSSDIQSEEEIEEEIPAEVIPVTPIETPVKEKVKEKVKPAPIENTSSGKYHVIVGSFTVSSNAERFVQKQGANASIVMKGGLSLVSIGSYSTMSEANQAMDNLDKAWIYVQE